MTGKKKQIVEYLLEKVDDSDEGSALYLKSRQIANEFSLSAKEVGYVLSQLAKHEDEDRSFNVKKHSYTNCTTWKITPAE